MRTFRYYRFKLDDGTWSKSYLHSVSHDVVVVWLTTVPHRRYIIDSSLRIGYALQQSGYCFHPFVTPRTRQPHLHHVFPIFCQLSNATTMAESATSKSTPRTSNIFILCQNAPYWKTLSTPSLENSRQSYYSLGRGLMVSIGSKSVSQ